jgi:dTDP-4-amino-4,6-dideoxygalactose transaminase
VGSGVYYPKLVPGYGCYRDHPLVATSETPVASRVARQCLSLPVHAALSAADLDRIGAAVQDILS